MVGCCLEQSCAWDGTLYFVFYFFWLSEVGSGLPLFYVNEDVGYVCVSSLIVLVSF